jgi:putative PIN family toxin of toxin-antitoxin system
VLVTSVISPTSVSAQIIGAVVQARLEQWRKHAFTPIISPAHLAEYAEVLAYPNLKHFHRQSFAQIDELIADVRQFALFVTLTHTLSVITEDPDDNRVLECVLSSKADYIVSGDQGLLRVQEYRGIQILSPAAFLAVLASSQPPQAA